MNFELLDYFKKYNGILSLNSKNVPKTNLPSSLFVTPKLGHSYVELLKDPSRIYDLTNKSNAMLLISDSSSFMQNSIVDLIIPHLESISIYYKHVSNIDGYPIILDPSMIKNGADLMRVLLNISPAYSGIELYKIEETKLQEAIKVYLLEKRNFTLFTTFEKCYLENQMKINKIHMNSLFVSACIFKAALETKTYILIPKELIDIVIGYLAKVDILSFYSNYYQTAGDLIALCVDYFIRNQLNGDKLISKEEVHNKYQNFLIEGKNSCTNGLIEIKPKYDFKDPSILDSLFTEDNFNNISAYLEKNIAEIEKITCKGKFIANVSDHFLMEKKKGGKKNSILNLPFMEGQASYSHHLNQPELIPICLGEDDKEETIKCIAPIFKNIVFFNN